MLTLLLTSMLTLAFNIQSAKASGTIYIRASGVVEGTDKIQRDGDTYTFTDNIYESIVIERDNIVVDGAGYTLQGTGDGNIFYDGIRLWGRSNVTIRNIEVTNFYYGIFLIYSRNNTLSGNTASNNKRGLDLFSSPNNTLDGNTVSDNEWDGIFLDISSDNVLTGNIASSNYNGINLWDSDDNIFAGNVASSNLYGGICIRTPNTPGNNVLAGNTASNNNHGIHLWGSSNTITGNNITNNYYGMYLDYVFSTSNAIYHNNFMDNTNQVYSYPSTYPLINMWNDGYPSGGNYWSDYSTRYPTVKDEYRGENQDVLGSDGIWDSPYVIDTANKDRFPLVNLWSPTPPVTTATLDIDPDTLNLRSKGEWITAYIELPAGHDVNEIDVSSIMLNNTISVDSFAPIQIGDHDSDGISDLMVKFSRAELTLYIYDVQKIKHGNVTLTLTGKLNDGTPFKSSDVIMVMLRGDVNNDRVIDILDLALIARALGTDVSYPKGTGWDQWNPNADLNLDDKVDVKDLCISGSGYGATIP